MQMLALMALNQLLLIAELENVPVTHGLFLKKCLDMTPEIMMVPGQNMETQ